MMSIDTYQRGRRKLIVVAMLVGSGMLLSACETVGGGESGAKHGPNNEHPNAKSGPGKFKSHCRPAYAETDTHPGVESFDLILRDQLTATTLGLAGHLGEEANYNTLLAWGGGGHDTIKPPPC